MNVQDNYRRVIEIRSFEEKILTLFGQNKLSGTTHTYIGEEATAVAIMKYVTDQDIIFSNHRCHGHYLAYGGPKKELLAEIMSKESGLCQGRGGSQHIHYKNFYTNGIQGGIVPNAVGVALADKYKGGDANTLVFLGDGTLGQGVVYESLNIASVYEIPVVFVIEDNQYAMSTKREDVIAGDIKTRIEAFDIRTIEITSTDVDDLEKFFADVFDYINTERKPVCAIVHNYRLGAHSKGDDTRDPDEIKLNKSNDPVSIVRDRIGEAEYNKIRNDFDAELDLLVEELDKQDNIQISPLEVPALDSKKTIISSESFRFVDGIREAFDNQLSRCNKIVFMGEDICDPYGGAFKATKGLSVKYGGQLLNMPISEAAMTGIAVGMALNGCVPIVEMMFGDFVTLAFDQLLNHASKYGWVYGNNVKVPMIIRTPMGAKRGYGPTHSQSLEKFLVGIPGVRVLAMTLALNPRLFYDLLCENISEPTVIIENKKMYGQKTWKIEDGIYNDYCVKEINNYGYSSFLFSLDIDEKPDCLLVTYGGMDEDALQAALDLMIEDEIQVDVLILTQLAPIPIKDIIDVAYKNVPIVTVEEGTQTLCVGAEILTQCVERGITTSIGRVTTSDSPIPNGVVLEEQIVSNKAMIKRRVKEVAKK